MAKRDPAANILNLNIPEEQKIEWLAERMLIGQLTQANLDYIASFVEKFSKYATAQQRVTFVKLHDMGWNLSRIVWNNKEQKIAFAVNAPDCAAWVTPDGKVNRAPVGKRTAYLDSNWKDVA
jgi:hypothetical protein